MKLVTPVRTRRPRPNAPVIHTDLPPQAIDETKVTRVVNSSNGVGMSRIFSTFAADSITVRGTPLEVMEQLGLPIPPSNGSLPTRKQLEDKIAYLSEIRGNQGDMISRLYKQNLGFI